MINALVVGYKKVLYLGKGEHDIPLLEKLKEHSEKGQRIILATDADYSGGRHETEYLNRLMEKHYKLARTERLHIFHSFISSDVAKHDRSSTHYLPYAIQAQSLCPTNTIVIDKNQRILENARDVGFHVVDTSMAGYLQNLEDMYIKHTTPKLAVVQKLIAV